MDVDFLKPTGITVELDVRASLLMAHDGIEDGEQYIAMMDTTFTVFEIVPDTVPVSLARHKLVPDVTK